MKDLEKKNENEIAELLREKRAALRDFRFSLAGSKAKNMKEGMAIRKDIARILTLMNARKKAAK